ncbi:MAG TPA: hypothetical protein VFX23_03630 [Limnobacter sp.]|uniref:hypothetical protein n=1 Tax=Limnobacter sp. TaxID=2003368 RepID=UPI002E33C694|nr:hypothetical protein [Limnobacter sp.]HEX5485067.1 hypothetical protein [Limnobacter sp.]
MLQLMTNNFSVSLDAFPAWPDKRLHKIGIWLHGGAQEAVAARRLLDQLNRVHPEARILVIGSRTTLAFFEMDDRVAAYLPIAALEPRRPAQSKIFKYLDDRAQFKKLGQLQLDACVAVCPNGEASDSEDMRAAERLWRQFVRTTRIKSEMAIALTWSGNISRPNDAPVMQPGPKAIAHANTIYHQSPPHAVKVLVYLGSCSESNDLMTQRIQLAQQCVKQHRDILLGAMGRELFVSLLMLASGDRLQQRRIADSHSSVTLINWNQLIGHMAYADWVVPLDGAITMIAVEMGRQSAVFPV